jgi:hypothetical protein
MSHVSVVTNEMTYWRGKASYLQRPIDAELLMEAKKETFHWTRRRSIFFL